MLERVFYRGVQLFFRCAFTVYNRMSIKWTEPLVTDEHIILACNHCSNLDPLVVGVVFPRLLRYFAKEELFRPFFLGHVIRILGAVPVSREANSAAAAALKGFLKLLEGGSDVLIFPEGGRSPDGKLKTLEGGVGLIAAHSKAPILPVYVKGTYDAMPTGASFVKPSKITVTFGKLLKYSPEFYREKGSRDKIMSDLTASLRALESEAK